MTRIKRSKWSISFEEHNYDSDTHDSSPPTNRLNWHKNYTTWAPDAPLRTYFAFITHIARVLVLFNLHELYITISTFLGTAWFDYFHVDPKKVRRGDLVHWRFQYATFDKRTGQRRDCKRVENMSAKNSPNYSDGRNEIPYAWTEKHGFQLPGIPMKTTVADKWTCASVFAWTHPTNGSEMEDWCLHALRPLAEGEPNIPEKVHLIPAPMV